MSTITIIFYYFYKLLLIIFTIYSILHYSFTIYYIIITISMNYLIEFFFLLIMKVIGCW